MSNKDAPHYTSPHLHLSHIIISHEKPGKMSISSSPCSSIRHHTLHATDEVASTTPPITEKPSEENVTQDDEAEDATYITGIALYAVLTGLTMAAFVLMLDTTIVVTVSRAFDTPNFSFGFCS